MWPEVDLGRLGWVAFDPVPATGPGTSAGTGAGPTTTVPVAQQGLNQVRQTVAAAQSASSVPAPAAGRHGSSTAIERVRDSVAAGGSPGRRGRGCRRGRS